MASKTENNNAPGVPNHYLCRVPAQKGPVAARLLKSFYSGIRDDPKQIDIIKQLPEDAIFVYLSKYHSVFDFLFFHTRYQQLGLKAPTICLDYQVYLWQPVSRIFKHLAARLRVFFSRRGWMGPYKSGFIEDAIINENQSVFLSLVNEKGFYRRFIKSKIDPLRFLIELQTGIRAETNRPVYIVPQLMFFGRTPEKRLPSLPDTLFGSEAHPGFLRRVYTLFQKPENVFIEISTPLNLQNYVNDPRHRVMDSKTLARELRQTLHRQMDRHRRSITGPMLKTHQELKEQILTSDRLRGFMETHAESKKMPLPKVHKKADGYLDEIAAKYNPALIRIGEKILTFLFNLMFEGINAETAELHKAKAMAKDGPLIFIPCHKSHIDYLVLPYVLHHNHLPSPHTAAGKNLSFWPLGPLFRRGGAFFIRRSFKGAALYARVFAEYVYKLLNEGFNIEVFIEGGRSRTGKLLTPKLGFISILLNAFKQGACEDMIFVPVYIGYDRVLEENAYLHEIQGGEKEPENITQVIRAGKFLKRKKWGRIYVKFQEPISLKNLLASRETSLVEMSPKEQNALCRELGNMSICAIDEISIVTPHALVAAAILNCHRPRFSHGDLMSYIEAYMIYLDGRDILYSDALLTDSAGAVDQVLADYVNRGFLQKSAENKKVSLAESEFYVQDNKRTGLEFYKNNCIVFFIPAAYTAAAILELDAFQFSSTDLYSRYEFLAELFKNEFVMRSDQPAGFQVRKTIKAFIDDAIIMPHKTLPDQYQLTASGFRKLKRFAAFITPFLESYRIVLTYFSLYPKNTVDAKRRIKKIASRGQRMYKRREIQLREALSTVNYKNAVDFFVTRGIIGSENQEQIDFYSNAIDRYLHRLSG